MLNEASWNLESLDIASVGIILSKAKKTICVFQVSALEKLGMVGRHCILFYRNILYGYCIFYNILAHFLAYLTIFCSQFTVKCLGSAQKPR